MPDSSNANNSPLNAAADAIKSRLLDSLHDADISARVTFQTSDNSEGQPSLRGVIEVVDTATVSAAESVLRKSISITARKWLSKSPGETPRLEFKAVIPPDVKPTTWSQLPETPNLFVAAIQGTLDMDEADQPTLLKFPEEFPSVALVMKGGGIKGLAYVGALEVLLDHYTFDRYVGTSAGAITALLLAAGYTTDELKTILEEKDFRDFFDARWWKKPINLLLYSGFNHAHAFTDWLDELLAKKLESAGRVKMADLPTRATVFASRKEVSALRFDSTTGDDDAAHAARCSMSIPLIFVPQSDQGFRTFDGGLQQNYPVKALLDEDPKTKFLGLYLGPEIYKPSRNRWQIFDWLSIWTESQDPEFIKKYRDQTVIIDPDPIGTLDFELTDKEKDFLLLTGRVGALAHLEKDSEQHQAAVTERDALKIEVQSIQRKRKWWKRIKRLVFLLFVLAACWYGPSVYRWWFPPEVPIVEPDINGSIIRWEKNIRQVPQMQILCEAPDGAVAHVFNKEIFLGVLDILEFSEDEKALDRLRQDVRDLVANASEVDGNIVITGEIRGKLVTLLRGMEEQARSLNLVSPTAANQDVVEVDVAPQTDNTPDDSDREKNAELESNFRDHIANALNKKPFKAEESTRKDKTNALGITNTTGSERWLDGTTGSAEIVVTLSSDGLTAQVILPYTAKYDAKNFMGVLSEYRDDPKECTGSAKFTATKKGGRIEVSDVEFLNASPSGSHDAGRMTQQAVREDVIASLAKSG